MSLRFAKEVSRIAVFASEVSNKWKNSFTNKGSEKSIDWRQSCAGVYNHLFHAVVKKGSQSSARSLHQLNKLTNQ